MADKLNVNLGLSNGQVFDINGLKKRGEMGMIKYDLFVDGVEGESRMD